MSSHYPFRAGTLLAAAAIALMTPAAVRAPLAQQGAVSSGAKSEASKSEAPKSEAPTIGAATAAVDHTNPAQKSIAARAVDKVKDMFARVPCLPPKGGYQKMGSLPHVASKLIAGQPVTIIAFGSSSALGFGFTS